MASVRRFSLVFLLSVTSLLVSSEPAWCASHAEDAAQDSAPTVKERYSISPSTVVPGNKYEFVITAPDSACKPPQDKPPATQPTSQPPKNEPLKTPATSAQASSTDAKSQFHPFDGVVMRPSSADDLTLGDVTPFPNNPCMIGIHGEVSADAVGEDLMILLFKETDKKKTEVLTSLRLPIRLAKPPSPIPPGLDPEVDLMWKVLPRRAVADSYGNRVADQYFAIETVIGNNSGWDLQIAALGFDMPYYDCVLPSLEESAIKKYNKAMQAKQKKPSSPYYVDSSYDPCQRVVPNASDEKLDKLTVKTGRVVPRPPVSIDMPTPIDAYPVVRSTIEREQHVGRRAVIVNLVKASGSTLVGIGGLLPDAGNFVKTTSIYNGPFEKGIELVYPDLTTLHLIGLDNRTLRDGTVIPNNTSVRVNVFISREIVMCAPPSHWYYFDLAPKKSFKCFEDDPRVPYQHDFNPADIRERLGELTVVGRKIQYLERVRVLSKTSDLPESKPGIVFENRTIDVVEDTEDQPFKLAGMNLEGVTLVSGSEDALLIKDQKVAADGRSISFKVTTKNVAPPTRVPITATSLRGFSMLSADVVAHVPKVEAAAYDASSKTITITGKYLDPSKVVIDGLSHESIKSLSTQLDRTTLALVLKDGLKAGTEYKAGDGGQDSVMVTGVPAKTP